MATVSVASKLRALKKKWKDATPRTGGGLPDGDYEGVIESGVIQKCKNDELQCMWKIRVTAPEGFEDRRQTKSAYLASENNLEWFKGDLTVLGIEPPEDIEDMPSAVGETEGLPIAFKVFNKQENVNVYFIGLLEGVEAEQPEEGSEEGGEDDLTADAVTAMGEADDEEALQAIIVEYELDIDQDGYETYAEVADLIIEALEL